MEVAIALKAEESLADGRPADTELAGERGVAESDPGRQLSAEDTIEELAVDVVAKGPAGDQNRC